MRLDWNDRKHESWPLKNIRNVNESLSKSKISSSKNSLIQIGLLHFKSSCLEFHRFYILEVVNQNYILYRIENIDRTREHILYTIEYIDRTREHILYTIEYIDRTREHILYRIEYIDRTREHILYKIEYIDRTRER